jgi:hypothetical protein
MNIGTFIKNNRQGMLNNLTLVVKALQDDIKTSPLEYYADEYDEQPSIDIRLCIDLVDEDLSGRFGYIFRTGSVDFDPYHSEYCAASSVDLDTNPNELLEELLNQVLEY